MNISGKRRPFEPYCNRNDEEVSKCKLGSQIRIPGSIAVRLRKDGIDINCATFWGLTDKDSWLPGFRRSESYPLLFTGDLQTKPAFDNVIAAAGK